MDRACTDHVSNPSRLRIVRFTMNIVDQLRGGKGKALSVPSAWTRFAISGQRFA